jgi:hypothetical protein
VCLVWWVPTWAQLGGSLGVLSTPNIKISTPKFSAPVFYNIGNSKISDFMNNNLLTGKID